MYQLHQKINCLGGRNLKPLKRGDIYVGAYCLALFEDEFHRAEIKMCSESGVQVCIVYDYLSMMDFTICINFILVLQRVVIN